ncbi:3-oxoacyl-[acyl-carrier-protein] synthase 2 [Prevotella herbatica]|uniref:3-oxoacyl-[acyl-carrier-protein] synthase 2 n=1 Tax=Prevotella herbatica TaxID=2801997 RepID=A0ABM7P1S6_9BACT|nr:beta-ketoacyl-ACP synthase II [Prevotella herbatica]BCS86682.1 3-oxoacyl-[acyl-carrier-protein] synthase 2 [Prevotella herbatica]
MKRVVITGLGAITPLGNNINEFWENIVNGKSGAAPLTKFDCSKFKTHFGCEVKDFHPEEFLDRKELRSNDLFTQYAIAASDEAIKDSQLHPETMSEAERSEIGVIWASGNGGIGTLEKELKEYYAGDGTPRFSPFLIPKMIVNMAAGVISIRNGLLGTNYATVSACSSSNTAIINAFDTIRLGKATAMICGGSEAAITESSIGGFNALQALSKSNDDPQGASRPFDETRNGFVIGEGAGALVLEDLEHALKRNATIYAEIIGGGMAADAYHITGTHPDGLGAVLCMQKALADAGLSPDKIDYINAHATSTQMGDISELKGIKKVFGDRSIKVTGTKSMTGHLLGAAGAIESIISILSIRDNIIPATINTENPDKENPENIDLVLHHSRYEPVNYVLNNTFGFGGHTASSIFKKYI